MDTMKADNADFAEFARSFAEATARLQETHVALRSQVERREDGALIATPFAKQDSSMLRLLAEAGGLVVRPPHAPPARTGDTVLLHLLGQGLGQGLGS